LLRYTVRYGGKLPVPHTGTPARTEEASMQVTILTGVGLAALIAASTASISLRATIVANEVSAAVDAIDILALTKNAGDLPVEEWPAF
jgi:hypothetical protein